MTISRRSVLCLLVGLALNLPGGPGSPCAADDAASPAAEPAAVLAVASVDRVLDDVEHLLQSGGGEPYSDFIRGFVAGLNDLAGVDRGRPLGAMLFLDPQHPDAEPAPMLCVPITDIDALKMTVSTTGNALEPTDDPRVFKLKLGKDELRVLLANGYALVTDPANSPRSYSPAAAVDLLQRSAEPWDVSLRVRRAGIPEAHVLRALESLARDASRDRQPRPDESDEVYRWRLDLQEGAVQLVQLLLTEAEELSAGIVVEPGTPLSAEVEFRSREGGALSALLNQTLAAPRLLPAAPAPSPALRLHASAMLSGRARELTGRLLAMARRGALAELGDDLPMDVLEQIGRAFGALDATASVGLLESRIDFLPTSTGRFVLLAGFAVAQPEAIDGAIRALIPLAAASGDLKRADLDALHVGGLAFHRLEGTESRARDRKLYGPDYALWLAAGQGALWLAVGGDETSAVLAAALGSPVRAPLPVAAGTVSVRLLPWLALQAQEGGEENKQVLAIAADALNAESAINLSLSSTGHGVRLSVSVDEAYAALLVRVSLLRPRKGESGIRE